MAGAPEPKDESRIADEGTSGGGRAGAGLPVDRSGGPTVDPTKNVLDLVRAESKYQDFAREAVKERSGDLRAAETRRVDQLVQAETRRQDELRNLETKRSDDLRTQKESYEVRMETLIADFTKQQSATTSDFQKQIAAILAAQTAKDALLLSQAVDKLTTSTDSRLAAVERNQYITGGTASVRDPGINKTLEELTAAVTKLTLASGKTESKTEGKSEGLSQIGAIVLGICTVIATIIAAAAFVATRS